MTLAAPEWRKLLRVTVSPVDVEHCRLVPEGIAFRDGGVDVAYAIGCQPAANGEALALVY
jgi:hypothetical protein